MDGFSPYDSPAYIYIDEFEENNWLQKHYSSTFLGLELSKERTEAFVVNILRSNALFEDLKVEINEMLIADYVREVWMIEFARDDDMNTMEVVDMLVEGYEKPISVDGKTWLKLRNIHSAVVTYLTIQPPIEPKFISIDLIKQIHQTIGLDVIEHIGEFRTQNVRANKSSVIYSSYSFIHIRLSVLIDFFVFEIQTAPSNPSDCLIFIIRLSAFFFSEFLLIHPFINGNGRTAGIILNIILRPYLVTPFSLYI